MWYPYQPQKFEPLRDGMSVVACEFCSTNQAHVAAATSTHLLCKPVSTA